MWLEPETNAGAEPSAVCRLISNTISPDSQEINPRLLTAIKSAVRSSDAEARAAVHSLLIEMKKPHSQVRYLAVLIADELFMRSKLFRTLLVDRLDEFLSLGVGFRANLPLPPPSSTAATLRVKSIEILEKWNDSFGIYYRQLRLGFNYLKNTLHYRFPNRLENQSRLQRERREKEARTKQIILDKFNRLRENYSGIMDEIRLTVDEIEECLDMLQSKEDNFEEGGDEVEELEFKSLALNRIREESLKEGVKVHESKDNMAIFDVLRESHKLLVTKRMPCVKEWISVLVRVDVTSDSDIRFRDAALKEFIDFQNVVRSVEERCTKLGCSLDEKREEEEEDLWEEGTIEVDTPRDTSSTTKSSVEAEGSVLAPATSKGKGKGKAAVLGKKKPSVGIESRLDPERSKLLDEAPVMNWGPFLDNWGTSQDVLANQRGLELENHWGRVDLDATIPAEKIAELNVQRTVYQELPVETQPCLAPLKKGGLCQRRDLKVCPFHGPIVPRDAEGNPIEQNPSEEEEPETDQVKDSIDAENAHDSVKETVERLAKRAVKNIRERDREIKAGKKAKLAKVREHNVAMLREAAMASTSYSEHSTATHEYESGKKARPGSRLRKKGTTTKDRIAQRLLKTNVTESSIRQVLQGEHSRYREAFPNQW